MYDRPFRSAGMSRREFLRLLGISSAAAAIPFTFNIPKAQGVSGTLRILQWSHFVPRYDEWFDAFAAAWGEENGVEVIVDHINVGEIPAATASEIAAGEGHDMLEYISPRPDLEPAMMDLRDINEEAANRLGAQVGLCTRSTYNATTDKWYGFCHSWVPDPGDYRQSLWAQVDMPDGPKTWADLLEGGTRIKNEQGVQMGIGMSNELDSNMACRGLMWAHGASVQDADENVVVNSAETIAALEYMKSLFEGAMTEEVFSWTAASNNNLLIAGQASFILNSISAYRTAQLVSPEVADDIFFSAPLIGPAGVENSVVSEHAIPIYQVPNHAQNPDAAKAFMLALVDNSAEIVMQSELYNFPAFNIPETAPDLLADGGWLDEDPFGSIPANKLNVLKNAESWSTVIGHPGPANGAIAEAFGQFIIPQMFAKVARGDLTAAEAAEEAEALIIPIFDRWEAEGFIRA
jgi:multiple sugar transport system substrate-binding protein